MQVHEALERSQEKLRGIRQELGRLLRQVPAHDVAVAHPVQPIQVPLEFKQPYAFRGAYLVADFDEVARAILTARHVGLMTRDAAERLLAEAARAVKRVFLTALRYEFFGQGPGAYRDPPREAE